MGISPDLSRSEMDVSARHALLTMKTVSGSIWMLDQWSGDVNAARWGRWLKGTPAASTTTTARVDAAA